jgi:hypothetical protein
MEPSEAVINAVAAFEGVEPTELDVLHDSIDPGALDHLVGHGNEELEITFAYSGYDITVHGAGGLLLREADAER